MMKHDYYTLKLFFLVHLLQVLLVMSCKDPGTFADDNMA